VNIVADRDIPFVADAFKDLGEVKLVPGREITHQDLFDCQCLIIRTVTQVNQALIRQTPVKFIGTATIGTDHIDLELLKKLGIGFTNAAGCNAEAAAEYVTSGLFAMSKKKGFNPLTLKAGIVGYGNVGSRLHQKLEALGIDCQVNDPLLEESGDSDQALADLDTILDECDFISLHVPLTRNGKYPTYHLLDRKRLARLRHGCVLVNAARGEVVDNGALLETLHQRGDLCVFLDTWENEPVISRPLMQKVDLATPHIAGYSVEGRLRGTQMVLDAACAYFNLTSEWNMSQRLPKTKILSMTPGNTKLNFWQSVFQSHCNIWRDHEALFAGKNLTDADFARHFDQLRRIYQDRLEYERFSLNGKIDKTLVAQLQQLQFQTDA
jgi:erythronate-4-phosphate dehydrogenase